VPATNRPATLSACIAALERARGPSDEVLVVDGPAEAGPAEARNLGVARAGGDVVVFVDADVEVHADALARIRTAFATDSAVAAIYGSYDDSPTAPGAVSGFRNLLHHWVHQSGAGASVTFWAGLGAVRRDVFVAAGGFDAERFARPSVEDIDLGMRLASRGERIVLDPRIQGTHMKRWTFREMVRTDFARRGVPWTSLLVQRRSFPTGLNLAWRHRASTVVCIVSVAATARRNRRLALGSSVAFVALNADFYRLLLRRRGPVEATLGVVLHAVHHLTSAAAAAGALVVAVLGRGRR
jgi:cellulose synthase/poly-beta-1,6-N-acetylglucosamine synthase-like glycosyltransferase